MADRVLKVANKEVRVSVEGGPLLAALAGQAAAQASAPFAERAEAAEAEVRAIFNETGTVQGGESVTYISDRVGAVARTMQDRGRDSVSVFDFMTPLQRLDVRARTKLLDHTAAFQAAINSMIEKRHELHLPWGDYSVTGLTADFSGTPAEIGFRIRGAGRTSTRLYKRGSTTDPILSIEHEGGLQTANVDVSDIGVFGNAKVSDGLWVKNCGSVYLSDLWVAACDIGINWVGGNSNAVERTYFSGNNTGVKYDNNGVGTSYANDQTIRNCRFGDNTQFGIDFGGGSSLRLIQSDIEGNGQTGNTSTGGLVIRGTASAEIGYATVLVDGCWLEGNKGRTIQVEAFDAGRLHLTLSNTTLLTNDGGRALYAAGGGVLNLVNVVAPSSGDTYDLTAHRVTINGGTVDVLTGTQTYLLIQNAEIGGAPVEGTHQRTVWTGGGYGLKMTWVGGTAGYEIKPDTNASRLNFTKVGTAGASYAFDGDIRIPWENGLVIGGEKVLGPQGSAVADATDAASAVTQLNALLARCRAHGLIDT